MVFNYLMATNEHTIIPACHQHSSSRPRHDSGRVNCMVVCSWPFLRFDLGGGVGRHGGAGVRRRGGGPWRWFGGFRCAGRRVGPWRWFGGLRWRRGGEGVRRRGGGPWRWFGGFRWRRGGARGGSVARWGAGVSEVWAGSCLIVPS